MRSHGLTVLGGVLLLSLRIFGASGDSIVIAADSAGPEYMPICPLPKCLNPRVTAKSGIGTANATVEAKVVAEDAAKWCATYKPMDKLCEKEMVRMGWLGFRNLYLANADCMAGKMTAIDGNTYTYIGVWEDGPGKGRPKFTTTNRRFPHTKWEETGIDVHPSGSITGWGGGSPNLAAQWEVLCAGTPAPAVKTSQPPAQAPQSAAPVPNAVQIRPSELQQFATETQLQSADFGTPEATAKIAAKAGFIDVVGVKLGAPLKEALDTLKAHNPNLTMDPMTMPPYEALPGVVMTPLLSSKKNTVVASGQEKETVGLLVTTAPNEPFVWGVMRELWYEKEDGRPTIKTIVEGLRQKYGQESKNEGHRLIWLYDAQGQQMPRAKVDEIMSKCSQLWAVGLAVTGNGLHAGWFNRTVVEGYYYASYGKDSFNGLCHSYSIVQAEYMAQSVIGKTSPPVVVNVKVNASNRQLEVSGITVSHTLLMREAIKLAEQRRGEAGKRELPKF
jgi:hypothetical protein